VSVGYEEPDARKEQMASGRRPMGMRADEPPIQQSSLPCLGVGGWEKKAERAFSISGNKVDRRRRLRRGTRKRLKGYLGMYVCKNNVTFAVTPVHKKAC